MGVTFPFEVIPLCLLTWKEDPAVQAAPRGIFSNGRIL
jgi:hypothetical protein